MSNSNFPGYGGKRPLLYIDIDRLFLDDKNPRLTKNQQVADQEALKTTLYKFFNLGEIAISMSVNGYFDEEPLVGIPSTLPSEFENKEYEELRDDPKYQEFLKAEDTRFVIVEGNRRLCTAKLLVSGERFNLQLAEGVLTDLKSLPVIIYPRRKDVIGYIGVRHIIGITKWDAYAKARYIASMREDYGLTIDEIQRRVGDTTKSARKTYASYKIVEIMEDGLEYDVSKAKEHFSYIILALGQSPIKEFLGIPKLWSTIDLDNVVPTEKEQNLIDLFSWLFGDRTQSAVIAESRDITGRLTDVLRSPEATAYLKQTRNLERAWERSDGERSLLSKYLVRGRDYLRDAAGLVPTNNDVDIRKLIEECKTAADTLAKLVG